MVNLGYTIMQIPFPSPLNKSYVLQTKALSFQIRQKRTVDLEIVVTYPGV